MKALFVFLGVLLVCGLVYGSDNEASPYQASEEAIADKGISALTLSKALGSAVDANAEEISRGKNRASVSKLSYATIPLLIAAGADVNAPIEVTEPQPLSYTPLMRSVWNPEVAKLLLAAGANIDAQDEPHGETALMWAVRYGQYQSVKLLIQEGANISIKNKKNESALTLFYKLHHHSPSREDDSIFDALSTQHCSNILKESKQQKIFAP